MPPAGLVILDKPEGPSSFAAVAQVRRALGTREVGHCGTLDPLASGVLVVAVGSWTRLVRVLTADDKRYQATIAFGTRTRTDDREGEVMERLAPSVVHNRVTPQRIANALSSMVGVQQQVPPAYSAIHVHGVRAYARARRGEALTLPPREVMIHALTLGSLSLTTEGAHASVHVECAKGTYVRSIARDVGVLLGVPAHLKALRRTASGAYNVDDAIAVESLGPSSLRTGIGAVRGVPLVALSDADARSLRQGRRVSAPAGGADIRGTALAHVGDELVALIRKEDDELVVERAFPGP